MKRKELIFNITSFILGIIGYGLIWYYADWKIALGVFISIWANNLGITADQMAKRREKLEALKNIDLKKQFSDLLGVKP